MKIDVILNHKKFQPEVEGMQFPPESYRINITRSDGMGISKIEAQTVLQTCIQGFEEGATVEENFKCP
ncbi:hypothetical protein [Aeromonas veronii]|uniref:hypothetical protein n=1 Tax=Aeromonas veronii TaxID=654 RepID=UPI002417CC5E|nr:hypothetical protein [Aeromonas veronii]WFO53639.1 hypothetical protein L1O00_21525 [Aeromonas veronii]